MVNIKLHDFIIDSISGSSGVFSGHNKQAKWKHVSKQNEGFGSIAGANNTAARNMQIINDKDFIDLFHKPR